MTDAAAIPRILAELAPVAGESRAFAQLHKLGIVATTAGDPLAALSFDAILPISDHRFALAKHSADQRGALPAYLLGARDMNGDFVDIAAWTPNDGSIRLLNGKAFALGAEQILAARIDPLAVHSTALDWLRADRQGVVILDDRAAAQALAGMTIATVDLAAGRALRTRLNPFTTHPPRIVIPKAAAHG